MEIKEKDLCKELAEMIGNFLIEKQVEGQIAYKCIFSALISLLVSCNFNKKEAVEIIRDSLASIPNDAWIDLVDKKNKKP